MNIAYLISAYKDPEHLQRLCRVLSKDMDGVHFFIHVDRKVDISPFKRLVTGDHVHYVKHRVWSQWGGYSQVLYQQGMLREALDYENTGIRFERFVIMTGQDYPLMSNASLVKYFNDKTKPFMIGCNLSRECHDEKYMERVTLYHYLRDIKVRKPIFQRAFSLGARIIMRFLPIRKKPYLTVENKRLDVYYSSSYMALEHDAAAYILNEMSNNKELVRYFRTSFVPEELLIPTIVFNSKLKLGTMELPDWRRGLIRVSALEYFEYGKSIKIFTQEDYDELLHCGKPFARKFVTGKSNELMDMLDKHNGV